MSLLAGNVADVYLCSGAGATFTDEACSLVSGTTYQISDTSKRIWDVTAAVVVKDGATTLAVSAYKVVYGTGKVILNAAPGGAVTVSGKYLTASHLTQCTKWGLNAGPNLQEVATFGDTWETKAAVLQKGSLSITRFYAPGVFFTELGNRLVIQLYEDHAAGSYYVAVCFMDTDGIEASEGAIEVETVSLMVTGILDYVHP